MFHLVTGGSGSGKSAFAETEVCRLSEDNLGGLYYIATMMPYGEETKRKILRHRNMRADKGFETIECYTGLEKLAGHRAICPSWTGAGNVSGPCVLLECMSNLVANELYQPDGAGTDTVQAVLRGVLKLKAECSHLVIVTNEVCSECAADSEEMAAYKQIMAEVNRSLAGIADCVTEVVYGIPAAWKCRTAGNQRKRKRNKERNKERNMPEMRLIIGGAYQGKLDYAKKEYGTKRWIDGAKCSLEEIYTCEGIYHFEIYIRRIMENGTSVDGLAASIAERNPGIVIVSTEIGYGLVPVDAFEREYREQVGRICTEIAAFASRVDRVVCGLGMTLKGE